MMTRVTRTSTTAMAESPETVWAALDAGFLDISKWAGGVKSSVANPATPAGVNGSAHGGRICDIEGVGTTDERITHFDGGARTLTYSVRAKGLPFFVDRLQNTWTVASDWQGGSTVDVEMVGFTKGVIGRIGALPLGRMLGKAAVGLPGDLESFLSRDA